MGFTVKSIDKKGPAYGAGLRKGDRITGFNGEEFIDYIDFIRFSSEEELTVEYESGGQRKQAVLQKDADEPLGLEFDEELLGKKGVCRNKCLFCFVDQLPKGMRKTLYVKDEDWRYSFIMGNYVTLSDVSDEELDRIIRRKASPLYISVHAADEILRKKLIGNPKARPLRPTLQRLAEAGIRFYTQVVVCPGINDGEALKETMEYLYGLYPYAKSLAIVPVGLTMHRQNLPEIREMGRETAAETLRLVREFSAKALKEKGTRFVFASDEIFIKAKEPLPEYDEYEDFPQIENGVGLIRKLQSETDAALDEYRGEKPAYKKVSIATGMDAYPFIREIADKIASWGKIDIRVYAVQNRFFGRSVTVSGLLTGADICGALAGKDLGEALLLPQSMLREREDVFLDDMSIGQMKKNLGVQVLKVPADGYSLLETLTGQG